MNKVLEMTYLFNQLLSHNFRLWTEIFLKKISCFSLAYFNYTKHVIWISRNVAFNLILDSWIQHATSSVETKNWSLTRKLVFATTYKNAARRSRWIPRQCIWIGIVAVLTDTSNVLSFSNTEIFVELEIERNLQLWRSRILKSGIGCWNVTS